MFIYLLNSAADMIDHLFSKLPSSLDWMDTVMDEEHVPVSERCILHEDKMPSLS
jgi:hypothetical protein